MAERLTEKNKISCFEYDLANFEHKVKEFNDYDAFYAYNMAVRKLGKLEDILEKYDLEVEELDGRIYNGAFNYIDKLKAETDRDTWKKACELACENMKLPVDILIGNKEFNECHSIVEYFYQQAKKEGNNE